MPSLTIFTKNTDEAKTLCAHLAATNLTLPIFNDEATLGRKHSLTFALHGHHKRGMVKMNFPYTSSPDLGNDHSIIKKGWDSTNVSAVWARSPKLTKIGIKWTK